MLRRARWLTRKWNGYGKELAIEKIEVKQGQHTTVFNFKVKDFHVLFIDNTAVIQEGINGEMK